MSEKFYCKGGNGPECKTQCAPCSLVVAPALDHAQARESDEVIIVDEKRKISQYADELLGAMIRAKVPREKRDLLTSLTLSYSLIARIYAEKALAAPRGAEPRDSHGNVVNVQAELMPLMNHTDKRVQRIAIELGKLAYSHRDEDSTDQVLNIVEEVRALAASAAPEPRKSLRGRIAAIRQETLDARSQGTPCEAAVQFGIVATLDRILAEDAQ